jgi:hypothetical protein
LSLDSFVVLTSIAETASEVSLQTPTNASRLWNTSLRKNPMLGIDYNSQTFQGKFGILYDQRAFQVARGRYENFGGLNLPCFVGWHPERYRICSTRRNPSALFQFLKPRDIDKFPRFVIFGGPTWNVYHRHLEYVVRDSFFHEDAQKYPNCDVAK